MVTKLLNLISEITLQGQLAKLQQGQAIGNEKHQRQLIDLITEQRLLLAESLFCLACQTPLSKIETLKLLSHLKKCTPNEDTGEIDQADMFVFFALLYCLNASSLEKHSQALGTGELYQKEFYYTKPSCQSQYSYVNSVIHLIKPCACPILNLNLITFLTYQLTLKFLQWLTFS